MKRRSGTSSSFLYNERDLPGHRPCLSTVYGIVKQSGAVSGLQWNWERGLRSRSICQSIGATLKSTSILRCWTQVPAGNETILLVEDDEALRNLAREILEASGYRVLEAGNADAALLICEQNGKIDLLLTDVVMPDLGGRELAQKLLALQPEMCVLYSRLCRTTQLFTMACLTKDQLPWQKPFSPNALGLKVRAVLGVCHDQH